LFLSPRHAFRVTPLRAKSWAVGSPAIDFDAKHQSHLQELLEPGEELRGICAASRQQGPFKGGAVALGVTDRRLLIQPLDRRGEVSGDVISIAPEQIASAKAGGAGGGWATPEAAIADHVAVRLRLKTTDGEKVNLMLMRGEGRVLGKLGGGEGQQKGMAALAEWFGRAD
jgi:hypothetical protein